MKLNIVRIFYLFVRVLPVSILFYFVFQYFITYDINTLFFLLGLFVSMIFVILFSKTRTVQSYQSMDMPKTAEYCNTFLLLKGAPISGLPLSQAMFGYMLFFMFFILFKYKLIDQNIQYLVMFPLFIVVDLYWNFSNNCGNNSLFIISLIIGCILGLGSAFLIDKMPMIDLPKFQKLDKSGDSCFFNASINTYKCYANPDILQP